MSSSSDGDTSGRDISGKQPRPDQHAADGQNNIFVEGFRLKNPGPELIREALEAAFDYRGDVTIQLADGEEICGYIFNRNKDSGDPYLDLLPQDSDARRRILYKDIGEIYFSGRDTASGKSWETWVEHHNKKKAARECGEDVGTIGLEPEPLN